MKNILKPLILLLFIVITSEINSQDVIINEVMARPDDAPCGGSNCAQSMNEDYRSDAAEYVELYNTSCSDVDISCWVLGSNVVDGGFVDLGGSIYIPDGTTLGPGEHYVIGGANAGAVGEVDLIVNSTNSCQTGSAWVLTNVEGWIGLYDDNGVPQDALYWDSSDDITQDSYNDSPCVPPTTGACNFVGTLATARDINDIHSRANYSGGSPQTGLTFSRIPDGGNWQTGIAGTISGDNCNGGTCNSNSSFTVSAVVTQPTSCGANDGTITLTPNPLGAYNYDWDGASGPNPSIANDNDSLQLTQGTYEIRVDDGACNWDTTITLSDPAPFTVSAVVTQPTSCGANDGTITLTPNPLGSYNYDWDGAAGPNPSIANDNDSLQLTQGTYDIRVDDGGCNWDTTITLSDPAPFTISATSSDPTCAGNDGTIIITPSPIGSYTYDWDGNAGPNPPIADDNDSLQLTDGTYTIRITDGGCIKDTTITLNAATGCGCSSPFTLSETNNTPNTNCSGISDCNYSGPTILINEMGVNPTVGDGSIYGDSPLGGNPGRGEWVELYNPDWCNSVDISGYIFGSYNSVDGGGGDVDISNGMAFVIPNGTVVPPQGFVIVRGSNAPVPPAGTIDVVMQDLGGNICIDGGAPTSRDRFWLFGRAGWFAFYDANGVPQDMVQWGDFSDDGNPFTVDPDPNDLNQEPCIPSDASSNGVTSLPSANASTSVLSDLGPSAANGTSYVRIPDGGPWSITTQAENTSYGTCNDLVNGCVIGNGTSTCNGEVTVIPSLGTPADYTYSWDDDLTQSTQTAVNLCAGTYTCTVTDIATGQCVETITVTISDNLEINTTIIANPTIGTAPLEVNFDHDSYSANNYTVSWELGDGTTNTVDEPFINTYSEGNYNVKLTIRDGNCSASDSVVIISVGETFICFPNVFTPNGDGVNDLFKFPEELFLLTAEEAEKRCIATQGDIIDFECNIFNRWGNKVYTLTGPDQSWDGTTNGGIDVSSGVYYFTAQGKGSANNETFEFSGTITLTR